MAARVKLNKPVVGRILKSAAMQQKLTSEAKKATAGMPDVKVRDPFVGRNRARVTIDATSRRGRDALKGRFGG